MEMMKTAERPSTVIDLPTKGLFYQSKKSQLTLEHLTTMDENLMCNDTIIQNKQIYRILYERKVRDLDKPMFDELIEVDLWWIMLNLRMIAYGTEYTYSFKDPSSGRMRDNTVNLTNMGYVESKASPDKDGLIHFTLPGSGVAVKYRGLGYVEKDRIDSQKARSNPLADTSVTETVIRSVKEIDGITDSILIRHYIESKLTIPDFTALRKEIAACYPVLDISTIVKGDDGRDYVMLIDIGRTFFFPSSGL